MVWNTIVIAINFMNEKKICTLMFIMAIIMEKCLSYLLSLGHCNVMFKVISDNAHYYEIWNTIVIVIHFCDAKKMIVHY